MTINVAKWGPLTILLFILAIIYVAVGGVVVIRGNMTYQEYLTQLRYFGGVVAISGIGKGLFNFGNVTQPATVVNNTTTPQVGEPTSNN